MSILKRDAQDPQLILIWSMLVVVGVILSAIGWYRFAS